LIMSSSRLISSRLISSRLVSSIHLPSSSCPLFRFAAKKAVYAAWDPSKPRSALNFNPFETFEGNSPDCSGYYPGEVRWTTTMGPLVLLLLLLPTTAHIARTSAHASHLAFLLPSPPFPAPPHSTGPVQGPAPRGRELPDHDGRARRGRGARGQPQAGLGPGLPRVPHLSQELLQLAS
jgi:hypothetical protein